MSSQTPDDPSTYELDPTIAQRLRFNDAGLIPVIVQAAGTKEVLMMAWMDRNEYWIKGLTSGHVQEVVSIRADCDGDTLLMEVHQTGAACHTGTRTCFDADLLG